MSAEIPAVPAVPPGLREAAQRTTLIPFVGAEPRALAAARDGRNLQTRKKSESRTLPKSCDAEVKRLIEDERSRAGSLLLLSVERATATTSIPDLATFAGQRGGSSPAALPSSDALAINEQMSSQARP